MGKTPKLEEALAELRGAGPVEVHEDGQWLAALSQLNYEVRHTGTAMLVHLWSEEHNLVRRVLRVVEQSPERIALEVQRFGRSSPSTLEFVSARAEPTANRISREKFRAKFGALLAQQFPDEHVDSLTTSADLEHSLSGCYARGLMHRGRQVWAATGVSSAEDAATIDSILTYGLIWLDRAREHAQGKVVAGLRLFLPEGSSRVTTHRLAALDPSTRIDLYEVHEARWRARAVDTHDIGNLATWLTPRQEVEMTLEEARPAVEPLRALAPESVGMGVPPGTRDVAVRFRGIEFARWQHRKIFFGLGDDRRELSNDNLDELQALVRELESHRHPLTQDTAHPLYRMQAERWLESLVQAEPTRIDARLDPAHLYAQVPAFAAGDRGVIDLLGVTREGRLVVVELKAAEDIHLVLQAVDYWLRVRWHQEQDEFQRYGYFAGIELQQKLPLLYLVAPAFRFHPATEVLLRYLTSEVEVVRVGLNEDWRRGLRVLFRQRR